MAALSWFEPDSERHSVGGRRNRLAFTLAALTVLLAVMWWLTPQDVSAHANLASADPAPNSELESAPDRIIIWFTEPIEPGLSDIRALDATGKQVDQGNSVVDDLNPLVMSVSLGDVPDGTYTVAWRNVSTVDGHQVRGSFVFAVGQALTGAPVEVVEQPLLQSPVAPLLRWLTLLGALTMVGWLVFELLVVRPALLGSRASESVRAAGGALSTRSLRLIRLAVAVFIAASVGQLLLLSTITHETSVWGVFGGPLKDL